MADHGAKHSCNLFLFGLLLFAASGCASGKLDLARQSFYSGRLAHASAVLSEPSAIAGRDRLLYFMESGVVAHHRHAYEESIRLLRQAADLIEDLSVISASRQSASLVTSERLTRYRGEYAERLWVHTYLMMNYLIVNDAEAALVEAKKSLEVFSAYPEALGSAYFTRALIAHCFEATGGINSAFIEYKKLAERLPDPAAVADKLLHLALQLGFVDEAEKFRAMLPENRRGDILQGLGAGAEKELVFFIHQGRAPVKIPQNLLLPPTIRFSFVTYRGSGTLYQPPVVFAADEAISSKVVKTDLAGVLNDSLKARAARMLAKETARVAAKEVIASNIDDDFLELLVRGVFFVMEEPDIRCWQTLPAYWSLLRISLAQNADTTPPVVLEGEGMRYRLPPFRPARRFSYFVVRQGMEGAGWKENIRAPEEIRRKKP